MARAQAAGLGACVCGCSLAACTDLVDKRRAEAERVRCVCVCVCARRGEDDVGQAVRRDGKVVECGWGRRVGGESGGTADRRAHHLWALNIFSKTAAGRSTRTECAMPRVTSSATGFTWRGRPVGTGKKLHRWVGKRPTPKRCGQAEGGRVRQREGYSCACGVAGCAVERDAWGAGAQKRGAHERREGWRLFWSKKGIAAVF